MKKNADAAKPSSPALFAPLYRAFYAILGYHPEKKAVFYMKKGDFGESLKHANRAIKLGGDKTTAYLCKGVCCLMLGETKEAIAIYRKVYPDKEKTNQEIVEFLETLFSGSKFPGRIN